MRNVAGLYVFDNALLAVVFTGPQVKAHLEKSAEYFRQVTGRETFTPDELTNAITASSPEGTQDYGYDVVGGLDAALICDSDVARCTGSASPTWPTPGCRSSLLRASSWRSTATASPGWRVPQCEDHCNRAVAQQEIRGLIIDWVTCHVDPPAYASTGWKLVSNGAAVLISG